MIEYYAGSIQYDTEDLQTADEVITRLELKDLIKDLKKLKSLRRGASLLFAAQVQYDGSEVDITNKVRREING
jgi:hypothetical protein|tara:strand:- start:1354 stop:1572 length:219 start_codon:yes stop_codon:yes gene_type:complete